MWKILVLGVSLGGLASAQLVPVSGKCGELTVNDVVGGEITYTYKTPAKFPNPSETKTLEGKWTTTCGTVKAESDGSTIKIISSKSIEDAWSFLDKGTRGYVVNEYGYYDYPTIQVGYNHFSMRLKLEKGIFQVYGENTADAGRVVGYKINGGKLTPLVFEGKFSPFKTSSKNMIDIYVKPNSSYDVFNIFQRLSINPKTKTITIYKKFTFPNQ